MLTRCIVKIRVLRRIPPTHSSSKTLRAWCERNWGLWPMSGRPPSLAFLQSKYTLSYQHGAPYPQFLRSPRFGPRLFKSSGGSETAWSWIQVRVKLFPCVPYMFSSQWSSLPSSITSGQARKSIHYAETCLSRWMLSLSLSQLISPSPVAGAPPYCPASHPIAMPWGNGRPAPLHQNMTKDKLKAKHANDFFFTGPFIF